MAAGGLGLVLALGQGSGVRASHGGTSRASVNSAESEGNYDSYTPAVSGDGRYVAFVSASALVADDTNFYPDIYVRDRVAGATERVSVSSSGREANGPSGFPSVSADGRFVAFLSMADLIDGDPEIGLPTVYVHDRGTGVTSVVSVQATGAPGLGGVPAISPDGTQVGFWSNSDRLVTGKTDRLYDVFVRDLRLGITRRIPCGLGTVGPNEEVIRPALSWDGRLVAFPCRYGEVGQMWVHDRDVDTLELLSVALTGGQANGSSSRPSISADGRYVAFESRATDLVARDSNNVDDIFVRDRLRRTTTRASVSSSGNQADFVGGINVFAGPVNLAPYSHISSISADGSLVAFASNAQNLVMPDTNGTLDVFVHDVQSGVTRRVSVSSGGRQGNDLSDWPSISGDGRVVAFHSFATNLVRDDSNWRADVFAYDVDEPASCESGGNEEGPLTGVIHEIVEPNAGTAASSAHSTSCEVLVPAGL